MWGLVVPAFLEGLTPPEGHGTYRAGRLRLDLVGIAAAGHVWGRGLAMDDDPLKRHQVGSGLPPKRLPASA